jgi:hypothetical protein
MGSLPSCTTQKTCTLIGCSDALTLNLSLPSGEKPNINVDLMIDGTAVSCPALGDRPSATCAGNVTSTMVEGQTCTQTQQAGTVTQTCTGNGIFHLRIEVPGTPKSVSYTANLNGAVVGQDSLSPTFQSVNPNGPGCDPACKQATADVTLVTP